MTFFESIAVCFRKYADFNGRAARSEFWWFLLFVALGNAVFQAFNVGSTDGTLYLGTTLSSIWSLLTLLPLLAVGARRLHDTGRSAIQLLWFFVPIAGLIVLALHFSEPAGAPNQKE